MLLSSKFNNYFYSFYGNVTLSIFLNSSIILSTALLFTKASAFNYSLASSFSLSSSYPGLPSSANILRL